MGEVVVREVVVRDQEQPDTEVIAEESGILETMICSSLQREKMATFALTSLGLP